MLHRLFILLTLCFVFACSSSRLLSKVRHYPFLYYFNEYQEADTLFFRLKNPVACPLRVQLNSRMDMPELVEQFGQLTLRANQDTLLKIQVEENLDLSRIKYVTHYGDPTREVSDLPFSLPFSRGKSYKVIQGYQGKFSHNTPTSQFAIDFDLQIGDTVTAAADGFVVGLIQDYKGYGTSKKWRETDQSNFLTLYHPESGRFTQYVHLMHKGSLVKLGDHVKRGQAIGRVGMTGFTTTPHLHFNVKVPTENQGFISVKANFENGLHGDELKKNQRVSHMK
ncbi:MAG: M23 family metallopeptidase [Bacteroidota bacterium]